MEHLIIPPFLGIGLWLLRRQGWLNLRLTITISAAALFLMVFVEGDRMGLTVVDSSVAGVIAAAAVVVVLSTYVFASNRIRGRESKHYLRW